MDERLFYIEENISGIWDNNGYSFVLKMRADGDTNSISFTDKENFPKTGSMGKFFIVKEDYYYILRLIFLKGNDAVNAMDFKIDDIDAATNKMQLSHNGIILNLTRVA